MKIARLELENVKRVKAVQLLPAENGLTVIGGKNGQGKTSVLDAIAWAVGGEKFRPSSAQRDDSVLPPKLHVVMDNGIVVDRDGKNSALKVTDPTGKRAGQALLDEFIEKLALDLPKFMAQSSKEKATTLLRVIGVEDKLNELESQEAAVYNRRHAIGQIADQKKKYAVELPDYPDAPEELVSASDLVQQQQAILMRNAENQRKRDSVDRLAAEVQHNLLEARELQERMSELQDRMEKNKQDYLVLNKSLEEAQEAAKDLHDESTAELEKTIEQMDEINTMVRANMEKDKAFQEANEISRQYDELTEEINKLRDAKVDLLKGAKLPLPDLSVDHGELLYKDKAWDCMSGSEQMIVAVAIIRALNPKCGFVLLDKLEQLDEETMEAFGKWLEAEGIQAICTRVSTGGECEIIIEDGMSVPNPKKAKAKVGEAEEVKSEVVQHKEWKEGEF